MSNSIVSPVAAAAAAGSFADAVGATIEAGASPANSVPVSAVASLPADFSGFAVLETAPDNSTLPGSVAVLSISHSLKGAHATAAKAANNSALNTVQFYCAVDTASPEFGEALGLALPKMLGSIVKDYAVAAARELSPLPDGGKTTIGSLELASIKDINSWMRDAAKDGIIEILRDYATESQSGRRSAASLCFPQVEPLLIACRVQSVQRGKLVALLQNGKIAPDAAWPGAVKSGLLKKVREMMADGSIEARNYHRVLTNLDAAFFAVATDNELQELTFE